MGAAVVADVVDDGLVVVVVISGFAVVVGVVAAAVDGSSLAVVALLLGQIALVTQKNGWTVMQIISSSLFMVRRVGLPNSVRQVLSDFA